MTDEISGRLRRLGRHRLRNRWLTVIGDGAGWSLDHDAVELVRVLRHSGFRAFQAGRPWPFQTAFFVSREAALRGLARWRRLRVAVCLPYYHGYPGEGDRTFDDAFDRLRRGHTDVARIQVTHTRMHDLVLESGIAPEKVRKIYIGVDTDIFSIPSAVQRREVRTRFGLPQSAVVIGSFQKDGDGWGAGLEPKRVKAPEILLRTLTLLKASQPDLFVLLSGPARGFVKRGLESAGIPFVHATVADHREVPSLYHALDAYIVASRQEGGPKAILESMASGVPIISTRVGQASELIRHGENGWLADVDDADALASLAQRALSDSQWLAGYQRAARETAEQNDYRAQAPQWVDFFDRILLAAK